MTSWYNNVQAIYCVLTLCQTWFIYFTLLFLPKFVTVIHHSPFSDEVTEVESTFSAMISFMCHIGRTVVPIYNVTRYSGSVCEGVFGCDEHLNPWALNQADRPPQCIWMSSHQLKTLTEQGQRLDSSSNSSLGLQSAGPPHQILVSLKPPLLHESIP